MNTHGKNFRITTFGESHGIGLGVVIDGLPSNFNIDFQNIKNELNRRKTGQNELVSQRVENDEEFEILSGIFEGKSTGHPICIIIKNSGQNSKDYSDLKDIFRPNHADLTYHLKYGIRDYRGGGRSSGRETVSRVIAGAIAKQYLRENLGIEIFAFTKQIKNIICEKIDYNFIENNKLRCGDPNTYDEMYQLVKQAASDGDSIGGIIECHCKNPPYGLGEPTFDKLKSRLAQSMLSIGGVLGFEYGAGFNVTNEYGSTYNEEFVNNNGKIVSKNNKYGGILGGISTGEDIIFRIAVKPTSSIHKQQKTVDIYGNEKLIQIGGRHDPCILPRIVPVIEAMCAIDILDFHLINQKN